MIFRNADFKTLPGLAPKQPDGSEVNIKTKRGFRHVYPNNLHPATQACLYLDYELARTLGAWGPECKITKFLKMPTNGVLTKQAGEDEYSYAPRKPDTKDSLRFILENGAGKQVDVTVNLDTYADESDYSLGLNNPEESSWDLAQSLNTNTYASWSQNETQSMYADSWDAWLRFTINSAVDTVIRLKHSRG